jgi:quercetin dioxygenase-like cupin family protein
MTRLHVLAAAVLLAALPALARQAPPQQGLGPDGEPARPTTLIENEQTRIVRVDILAKSTRSMHNHPDMLWHVFVTMEAPMVLTIEGQKEQVKLGPWQTHFFKGGTTHSITNPGPRPVRFLEFFSKRTPNSAALAEEDTRELALAMARALGQ